VNKVSFVGRHAVGFFEIIINVRRIESLEEMKDPHFTATVGCPKWGGAGGAPIRQSQRHDGFIMFVVFFENWLLGNACFFVIS